MLKSEPIKIAYLDILLHDQLHPAFARKSIFATEAADRFRERGPVAATQFELDKFPVRLTLFFQVAVRGNLAVFQNQDFVAAFFHVAQQM